MRKYQVGDVVQGIDRKAQIPSNGGVVSHIVGDDYYYINHIDGGGIGSRGGEELVFKKQ